MIQQWRVALKSYNDIQVRKNSRREQCDTRQGKENGQGRMPLQNRKCVRV